MDLQNIPGLRPDELQTYHKVTYGRISPSSTKFDAKGKTLLITAGATGIGYAISESFAQAGVARIIIIQRRESVLAAAKESLQKAYPNTKVETYAASQSDHARMTEILQAAGEIDVLVPCATSVGGSAASVAQSAKAASPDEVADIFSTNVVGFFHLVREFLALPSTAEGRKTVISVSSNASQFYFPGIGAYGASKAAANVFMTHFAMDSPDGNVRFYSLHPGIIYSPLVAEKIPKDAMVWEDVKLPGDFAVWLASPEADFLNGRFVWAQWDVDELLALKDRVAKDPLLLTTTLGR